MRLKGFAAFLIGAVCSASAQFQILDAHTTASLRGIDAVSEQIAWASGTNGTVLLTTDGGATWKHCAVPRGAEKLDLRGVQGFDARTAVAMASGPGAASALFRTTDGCATWTEVFPNPDEKGFFDAIRRVTGRQMYVLGDPVDGNFAMFYSPDQGAKWYIADDPGRTAVKGDGAFAAGNAALTSVANVVLFGTAANPPNSPKVYCLAPNCAAGETGTDGQCPIQWLASPVPMASGSSSAGVFALAGRGSLSQTGVLKMTFVAAGGDYSKPAEAAGTAAYSTDGGVHWQASATPPAGYRSAVAYSRNESRFLAVGPTGTDVSSDDGKTWRAIKPAAGDSADADQGWNALSLPFAVGANGKIGRLREGVLTK